MPHQEIPHIIIQTIKISLNRFTFKTFKMKQDKATSQKLQKIKYFEKLLLTPKKTENVEALLRRGFLYVSKVKTYKMIWLEYNM